MYYKSDGDSISKQLWAEGDCDKNTPNNLANIQTSTEVRVHSYMRIWGDQFLYLGFVTTGSKQDWQHSVPGCKSIVFLTNGVKKPGTPLDYTPRPYNGLTIDVIWVLLLFLLRFPTLILSGTYTGLELILNLLHSWHASNQPPPTQPY